MPISLGGGGNETTAGAQAKATAAQNAAAVYTDTKVAGSLGLFMPGPPLAAGGYYLAGNHAGLTTGSAGANNEMKVSSFPVRQALATGRIVCDVATAGEAGATLRLVVYTDLNGAPSALLYDSGNIAADSTGVKGDAVVSLGIPAAGIYWVGTIAQNAVTTRPVLRTPQQGFTAWHGSTTPGGSTSRTGFNKTGVAGAAPNPFGTPTGDAGATTIAAIWLRSD